MGAVLVNYEDTLSESLVLTYSLEDNITVEKSFRLLSTGTSSFSTSQRNVKLS